MKAILFNMQRSNVHQQLAEITQKLEVLDEIVRAAKTPKGRLSDDGKSIVGILLRANVSQSDIARLLDVTPSAITRYK